MAKSGGRFGGIPSSRTPTHPGTSSSKGPALPTGSYGAVGPARGQQMGKVIGGAHGVPSGIPGGTPRSSGAMSRENTLGNPRGQASGGTMPPSLTSGSGAANVRNGVQQVHSALLRGTAKGYGPKG
jgi:hypothetical protein